jgi:MOSC domain-containing protein YiiM
MGKVEHIHIALETSGVVQPVQEIEAVRGVGLLGDRYASQAGHPDEDDACDLTLIEAEAIEALAADSGIELQPGESRRNVTTRGIALNGLVGRHFWVGEVLAQGFDLCEPCSHLVKVTGKPLLKPLVHRGGLRARLLTSGHIRVGDGIEVAEERAAVEAAERARAQS